MKKIDRAEAIRLTVELIERAQTLLDVLLPDEVEDGCPHPAEAIEDCSTLDDDGQCYRCTKCGAESSAPFPSIIPRED